MAAFLDAIGLVSGALGVISFAMDNFPGDASPSGAVVGLKAGLAANLTEAGGGINAIYGYDADNEYLGSGDGGSVDEGGLFTSRVDQSAPDTQADFIGVTFTDDAVCVAWITVAMHDGSPSGAWTGDVGSSCGEVWYTQTQTAGKNPDDSPYIPNCAWFDGDHTTGAHASLKFRTRAYGLDAQSTINNGHQCDSTIYGVDNTPISGAPAKRKRDTSIRPQWMLDQLIVSSIPQHSAQAFCDSETSWGPDFVDAHGQFCDMGTKTLTPLCTVSEASECVEIVGSTLSRLTMTGRHQTKLAGKAYVVTKYW